MLDHSPHPSPQTQCHSSPKTQRRIQRVFAESMSWALSGFFAALRRTRRENGNFRIAMRTLCSSGRRLRTTFTCPSERKTKHNKHLVIPSERSESRNLRLVGCPILLRFCEEWEANRISLHCVRRWRTSVGMTMCAGCARIDHASTLQIFLPVEESSSKPRASF